jgi:hypothetical protein
MNSFEVVVWQTSEHRAQLYHEAEVERLVAEARAGRPTLRMRLAQALCRLAERLDTATTYPCEPSHVRV